MTDIADRASRVEEMLRNHALRQRAREAAAASAPGPSRTHCADCGCAIPAARQRAVPGCQRCTECAARREQTRGLQP
jgi:phage/conjugal plasmid C-4 type zinc finger TraR family protein